MNPTLLDIAILFTFIPVWACLCALYEHLTDPRTRRRRQRKARRAQLRKQLERQGRFLR